MPRVLKRSSSVPSWLAAPLAGAALVVAMMPAARAAQTEHSPRPVAQAGQSTLPPCTCRAEGREFDMGASICLQTPEGRRIATCEMDQNVTSWRPTERRCPGEPTS